MTTPTRKEATESVAFAPAISEPTDENKLIFEGSLVFDSIDEINTFAKGALLSDKTDNNTDPDANNSANNSANNNSNSNNNDKDKNNSSNSDKSKRQLVHIRVIKGENIKISDYFSRSSDPYCVVQYGKDGNTKCKSPHILNNRNPRWHFGASCYVDIENQHGIIVKVFDHDKFFSDEALGHVVIPFDALDSGPKWYDLKEVKSSKTNILLCINITLVYTLAYIHIHIHAYSILACILLCINIT